MPETTASATNHAGAGSEVRAAEKDPAGVLPKNMKPWLYVSAAGLVIAAAFFSGTGRKAPSQQGGASHQVPQPSLQDNTESNQQELKSATAAAEQKMPQNGPGAADPSLQNATPAQQAAAAGYGPNGQPIPCAAGQPCPQQGAYAQQQISPAQQEEQQIAAKDRELTYASRFASNLVYTRAPDQPSQKVSSPALADSAGATGPKQSSTASESTPDHAARSLITARMAGDPPAAAPSAQAQTERKPEVNIDSATGQPYVVYEGTTLDTVLMNRLDGTRPPARAHPGRHYRPG
jgi:type IV secretion system protein VirB10